MTDIERDKELNELYAEIKKHGWIIDVRSTEPTLIKAGTPWAKKFDTMEAAIMFALEEIRNDQKG